MSDIKIASFEEINWERIKYLTISWNSSDGLYLNEWLYTEGTVNNLIIARYFLPNSLKKAIIDYHKECNDRSFSDL